MFPELAWLPCLYDTMLLNGNISLYIVTIETNVYYSVRLSLIYAAREFENMSSLEPNTLADRLLAIKISSLASSINMKGYE